MNELTVDLHAPGMTALHRAGAAGLYMAVEALRERGVPLPGFASWDTTPTTVTLRWVGKATVFFEALVRHAFGVAPDGFIDLASIDRSRASPATRWIVHEGMLGSFCQHGPSNKLGALRSEMVPFDDGTHPLRYDFRPVVPTARKSYPHRDNGGKLIGNSLKTKKDVPLAQWLAPGMIVRHSGLGAATALGAPPPLAVALLFAPLGCFYFRLQSRRAGRKSRFALAVPYINDLQTYADVRRALAMQQLGGLVATCAGHVGLELLRQIRSDVRNLQVHGASVMVLGTVTWNEKQKSRTGRAEVLLRNEATLNRYARVRSVLPDRVLPTRDGGQFIAHSSSLELFADNLAAGRLIYQGFVELMNNKDIREFLGTERKGLNMLVTSEDGILDPQEVAFVEACHKALSKNYGIAGERAKGESVDGGARLTKVYERWRIAFGRARNLDSFRKELMDFWSRGGANSTLQGQWKVVLPFLTATRWKHGRDLALLALASYARAEVPSAVTIDDARVDDNNANDAADAAQGE
jgi:CRISPR-associated protein Cas8a1/Csx13